MDDPTPESKMASATGLGVLSYSSGAANGPSGAALTTLCVFADDFEANLARSKLEADGVPAFLDGENVAAIGPYAGGPRKVRLHVATADLDRARAILSRIEAARSNRKRGGEVCPACRSARVRRSPRRLVLACALLLASAALLPIPGLGVYGWLVAAICLYLFFTVGDSPLNCLDCGQRFRAGDADDDDEDEPEEPASRVSQEEEATGAS